MSMVVVAAKLELRGRAGSVRGFSSHLHCFPRIHHRPPKLLISHRPLVAGTCPSAGDPSQIHLSSLLSASLTTDEHRGTGPPPVMVGRLEPQGQGGRPPAAVLLNVHPSPEELERKMASLPLPPPGDSDSISLGGAPASVILCVAKGENRRLQNLSSPVASKSDLESLLCLTVNGATWMNDLNSLSSVSFSEGTFRANSPKSQFTVPRAWAAL